MRSFQYTFSYTVNGSRSRLTIQFSHHLSHTVVGRIHCQPMHMILIKANCLNFHPAILHSKFDSTFRK